MHVRLSLIVPTLVVFAIGAGASTQSAQPESVQPQDGCQGTPTEQSLQDTMPELLDGTQIYPDLSLPRLPIISPFTGPIISPSTGPIISPFTGPVIFPDLVYDPNEVFPLIPFETVEIPAVSVEEHALPTLIGTPVTIIHPDGLHSTDFADGSPSARGAHQGHLRVGIWVTWHECGAIERQGMYVRGQRHGAWTKWLPDGQVESQGRYVYGRREGRWFDYHDNGVLQMDATYVNGQLDGGYRTWHRDGTRHYEGSYFYGSPQGPWRGWHANGQLAAQRTYHYGERVGDWSYFDENGAPTEKHVFYFACDSVRVR